MVLGSISPAARHTNQEEQGKLGPISACCCNQHIRSVETERRPERRARPIFPTLRLLGVESELIFSPSSLTTQSTFARFFYSSQLNLFDRTRASNTLLSYLDAATSSHNVSCGGAEQSFGQNMLERRSCSLQSPGCDYVCSRQSSRVDESFSNASAGGEYQLLQLLRDTMPPNVCRAHSYRNSSMHD